MSVDQFLNSKILVKQVRSESKASKKQKANLIGLGLRGVSSSSELNCTKDILGMLIKVNHLIAISKI